MPTDNQLKVSIAMPVYNGDRHICQAPNFRLPTLSLPLRSLRPLRFT
ncbi:MULTISPECIES: hypothetical protein [unclassified Microcoleus]